MSKIRCADGGSASQGETFEFENHSEEVCTIGSCSTFLTQSSYSVPAKNGTTPGSVSASVQSNIANGSYDYTASCRKKRGNPQIHIQSK